MTGNSTIAEIIHKNLLHRSLFLLTHKVILIFEKHQGLTSNLGTTLHNFTYKDNSFSFIGLKNNQSIMRTELKKLCTEINFQQATSDLAFLITKLKFSYMVRSIEALYQWVFSPSKTLLPDELSKELSSAFAFHHPITISAKDIENLFDNLLAKLANNYGNNVLYAWSLKLQDELELLKLIDNDENLIEEMKPAFLSKLLREHLQPHISVATQNLFKFIETFYTSIKKLQILDINNIAQLIKLNIIQKLLCLDLDKIKISKDPSITKTALEEIISDHNLYLMHNKKSIPIIAVTNPKVSDILSTEESSLLLPDSPCLSDASWSSDDTPEFGSLSLENLGSSAFDSSFLAGIDSPSSVTSF